MKNSDSGHYRLDENDLKVLWSKCTFVLDTNVLLNLYRYPPKVRSEFIDVLRAIEKRLWMPHQVALEFRRNRRVVISGQIAGYESSKRDARRMLAGLASSLVELHGGGSHPEPDPALTLSSIEAAIEDFAGRIDASDLRPAGLAEPDAIQSEIDSIFEGRIGPQFPDQSSLDEVFAEGELRFKESRPPGYLDKNKESQKKSQPHFYHDGLRYERKYGDLLIWKQMLAEVRESGLEYVLFVTDDSYEDWWRIVRGRTIGPRPELIQEMKEAGALLFHMYSSERFLQSAKSSLALAVSSESIDAVRVITTNERAFRSGELVVAIHGAVHEWIRERHGGAVVHADHNIGSKRFDAIVERGDGTRIGYEIVVARENVLGSLVAMRLMRGAGFVRDGYVHEFHVVVVATKPNPFDSGGAQALADRSNLRLHWGRLGREYTEGGDRWRFVELF